MPTLLAPATPDPTRNSERSTWRRCRLKWYWSYRLRLEPQTTKGALTFGRLAHEALEVRYPPGIVRGPHPAETFERLYLENERRFAQWDEDGERYDALELGMAMMNGYVDEWGDDDEIEIIQPELPIAVDVFDKRGRYLGTWVGKSDAAYRSRRTKRIGLLEHKTAKSIDEELRINSGYGEQGLSYLWASNHFFHHNGMLAEGEDVDHVRFNWLRKALLDDRPKDAQGYALNGPKKDALLEACAVREIAVPAKPKVDDLLWALTEAGVDPSQFGERSKLQPRPLFHRWDLDLYPSQMATFNRRLRAEMSEMSMARKGKLAIYKNPTKDCSWDCPFKEACELHEMGQDYKSILELEFDKWDPYDDHELAEEKAR